MKELKEMMKNIEMMQMRLSLIIKHYRKLIGGKDRISCGSFKYLPALFKY